MGIDNDGSVKAKDKGDRGGNNDIMENHNIRSVNQIFGILAVLQFFHRDAFVFMELTISRILLMYRVYMMRSKSEKRFSLNLILKMMKRKVMLSLPAIPMLIVN